MKPSQRDKRVLLEDEVELLVVKVFWHHSLYMPVWFWLCFLHTGQKYSGHGSADHAGNTLVGRVKHMKNFPAQTSWYYCPVFIQILQLFHVSIYISTRKKRLNIHLQLLVVFYNLQQNHHESTTENMVSFQCVSYTKPHFPLHKLQKYPSYKESVYKL